MAISTIEILGSDSVGSSRVVINTNTKMLENEINLIENFLDPSASILDGLNNITTNSLMIGTGAGNVLTVTSSNFTINNAVTLNSDITINGKIINNGMSSTDITTASSVGSLSQAPPYTLYRVSNSSTAADYAIQLYPGVIGQEVTFVVTSSATGTKNINIVGNGINIAMVPTATNKTVILNSQGATVTFKCVPSSTGVLSWYIKSSYNINVN
jgi:hypothetical protein